MAGSKKSPLEGKSTSTKSEEILVIESTTSATDTSTSKVDASKADTSKANTEKTSTEANKKTKTGFLWFITIINLVLILGLLAAAYWYYTQIAGEESDKQTAINTLSQQINDQQQNSDQAVRQINQNIQALKDQISSTQNNTQQDIEQVQTELESAAAKTDALGKRLAEMSGRRPSDWLLAEANYLVSMASRKVYIENDIRTAMTLLQEADARLEDLNDPSLFPVRAQIAGDIQSLKQVNPVSTNSIALALAGMLPKISELPLDKLQLPESETKDLSLSEDVSDWRENLSLVWQSLVDDLISIDYQDEPLEPYLAERQQWLIEQQLKHALSQAQTAALNEQVELYRSTTQQAIGLLVEHYQLDDPQVSQFLVALQELQNIDFSRDLPQKLNARDSLKDIIELRIQGLFNNTPSTSPALNEKSGNQS